MSKTIRVAVLSAVFALFAAPVFAGPGGDDPPPPPPPPTNSASIGAATVVGAILTSLGL